MQPVDLLTLSLAVFIIAYALTNLSLPFNVMDRVRNVTTVGGLLICFYCLSFWIALMVYAVRYQSIDLISVCAIWGAAAAVFRYTGGNHV